MSIELRKIIPEDRTEIAALQIASWQANYRGALPDTYLDGALSDDMFQYWATLEPASNDIMILAEDDGNLVGFIYVWCRPDPYIDNLHVSPNYQSQGIGRQLMSAAASALIKRGHKTAYLTVVDGNHRAVRFYESLGGITKESSHQDIFSHSVSCVMPPSDS